MKVIKCQQDGNSDRLKFEYFYFQKRNSERTTHLISIRFKINKSISVQ